MKPIRRTVWTIEKVTGYKPITTFWSDFTTAEFFGLKAIQDTFNRAFKEWKDNAEYVTELSMVLNHKIWQYYEDDNEPYARLYDKLWKQVDSWCCDNLKGKDLEFYFNTTD